MNNHNDLKPNLRQYAYLFEKLSSGKPIWKIGIYARLSKEDKKTVSASIINQIKIMARALRSYDDFEIYDIYIEAYIFLRTISAAFTSVSNAPHKPPENPHILNTFAA